MSTMTQRTRNVKPVSGSVRWLRRPAGPTHFGRLAITNAKGQVTEYDCQAVLDDDGRILGIGIAKDDDTIYHIDLSQPWGATCDCPDATFQERSCKHIGAVKKAFAVAGIVLPDPQRPQYLGGF